MPRTRCGWPSCARSACCAVASSQRRRSPRSAELARYRRTVVEERTREGQRLRKVLEDGGIKLDSVASDALGVSGRAMIEALIGGQRDPAVLADLARGTLRRKIPDLTVALAGRFADHHAVLCRARADSFAGTSSTVSPTDTPVTPSPTSSTTPAASYPR